MSKIPTIESLCLCGFAMLLAVAAAAQINLPQLDASVAIPEATRAALAPALQQAASAKSSVLSAELERSLVELLPEELREACPRMISHWGDFAQGTAQWSIRSLAWQLHPGSMEALAAFRCGSSHPDYADYFDERLAVLVLEPGASRLRLVPLADDCDNCSDLYHLDFSDTFPLSEGDLVAVAVTDSSDNPCCDGPSAWRRESLLYVVLPAGEIALKVERSREDYQHDDENGDWEEICGSTVMDTTVDDRLIELTLHTVCRTNGEKSSEETRSYRWNGITRRLDPLPPTQP